MVKRRDPVWESTVRIIGADQINSLDRGSIDKLKFPYKLSLITW